MKRGGDHLHLPGSIAKVELRSTRQPRAAVATCFVLLYAAFSSRKTTGGGQFRPPPVDSYDCRASLDWTAEGGCRHVIGSAGARPGPTQPLAIYAAWPALLGCLA